MTDFLFKNLQTNLRDIYAAGDIVEFPLFLRDNATVNVQHWQMACKHGRLYIEIIRKVPPFDMKNYCLLWY